MGYGFGVEDLSRLNRRLVLNLLRNQPGISRSMLVKLTELTGTSVSRIVSELLEQDLILEKNIGESNGGRKPICLEFNNDARYIVGVDIRPDKVGFILSNLKPELIREEEIRLDLERGQDENFELIMTKLVSFLEELPVSRDLILGIGVIIPGLVDSLNGVIRFSPHMNWHSLSVKNEMEERTGIRVSVENTTTAVMLAEKWIGAGRNKSNYVYLYIGEGIGAGCIFGGEVYRGSHFSSVEIGHSIIDPNGPDCGCGMHGCWESLASSSALKKNFLKALSKSERSKYMEIFGYEEQDKVLTLMDEYPEARRKAIDETLVYLNIGLVNVINTFIPEHVIIDGWPKHLDSETKARIVEQASCNAMEGISEVVDVEFSSFVGNGPRYGAVTVILDSFLRPVFPRIQTI